MVTFLMKIVTKIFTNASELSKIKKDLDIFLNSCCKNPFNLYPFVENYMRSFCQDSIPVILVSSVNKKIVGLAPLQLTKNLFIWRANFLFQYFVSPDFIVADEFREEVLRNFLYIIVKKLKCKIIDLDLPAESQNLPILERVSSDYKLVFRKQFMDAKSHCLISVQGSLSEFEKSQGGQFKRKFRRISRNIDEKGEWKVEIVENLQNDQNAKDSFNKMMTIERTSWKEKWRLQAGCTIDKDLLWFWDSSLSATKTNPDFKCKIWFLELNNQSIAYHFVIEYRGTAFITKTSFAEKYRQLSPGIFVHQAIIAELFRTREIETIDFLTNLPFMKTWSTTCLPRVTFTLNKSYVSNPFIRNIIALAYRFKHIKERRKI
jgi:hypothetical protein